jgi:hypothetical protein
MSGNISDFGDDVRIEVILGFGITRTFLDVILL